MGQPSVAKVGGNGIVHPVHMLLFKLLRILLPQSPADQPSITLSDCRCNRSWRLVRAGARPPGGREVGARDPTGCPLGAISPLPAVLPPLGCDIAGTATGSARNRQNSGPSSPPAFAIVLCCTAPSPTGAVSQCFQHQRDTHELSCASPAKAPEGERPQVGAKDSA